MTIIRRGFSLFPPHPAAHDSRLRGSCCFRSAHYSRLCCSRCFRPTQPAYDSNLCDCRCFRASYYGYPISFRCFRTSKPHVIILPLLFSPSPPSYSGDLRLAQTARDDHPPLSLSFSPAKTAHEMISALLFISTQLPYCTC